MISIHLRPPEIEDRLMPGHWELNMHNTAILASLLTALSFTVQAESARTTAYTDCMDSVDYGAFKNSQWQE